jgi:acyl-CoA synthetase (AMP-forming)/AMP-acid ligase II
VRGTGPSGLARHHLATRTRSGRRVAHRSVIGEAERVRPQQAQSANERVRELLQNEDATSDRFKGGSYWSGDLAYRDKEGRFYFAGRSNEWLRVDSENFAAAPVKAIVARFPGLRSVAVYAVPDDPIGDRVMAAIELEAGVTFAPIPSMISLTRSQTWAPNGGRCLCG